MSEPYLFRSSLRKLNRAIHHYNDLQAAASSYGKSLSLTWETSGPDAEGLYTHRQVPSVRKPDLFEDAFGDCVQNARSSLDMIIYELASARGLAVQNMGFPFENNADTLTELLDDKRRKGSQFTELGAKFRGLVEAWRPYRGGNKYLRAVHDLAILDRHRDITRLAMNANATLTEWGMQILGTSLLNQANPQGFNPANPQAFKMPSARVIVPVERAYMSPSPTPDPDDPDLELWKVDGPAFPVIDAECDLKGENALHAAYRMLDAVRDVRRTFYQTFPTVEAMKKGL